MSAFHRIQIFKDRVALQDLRAQKNSQNRRYLVQILELHVATGGIRRQIGSRVLAHSLFVDRELETNASYQFPGGVKVNDLVEIFKHLQNISSIEYFV